MHADTRPMVRAFIACGANLGDRRATIASALMQVRSHARVLGVCASALIETAAVGPGIQGPYLNGAISFQTDLPPAALLNFLHGIERGHGRERSRETRWGPRTLDLDLLMYGDQVIDEPGLRVPHPRMHERRFVLEPLAEIAGEVIVPMVGLSVRELLRRVPLN